MRTTLTLTLLLLSMTPTSAAASGSGVVTLKSRYFELSARSPHKIPMRGRADELNKQIEQWKQATRPKLQKIRKRLVSYLRGRRALLRPVSSRGCTNTCKELKVTVSDGLMGLDWTSFYRARLALRPGVTEAKSKALTAGIVALVRREHAVASIEQLPKNNDGDMTLYDSVAAAMVQPFDKKTFQGIQRRLSKKRARKLLNFVYLQAANRNKPALIPLLLKMGADRDFKNNGRYHDTAVHLAAAAGHLDVLRALFKGGAKADLPNEFEATPLLNAVRAGKLDAARLLIKRGANVNHLKQKYWSPLHSAAAQGSAPLVKLLLKHGAKCVKPGKRKSALAVAKGKKVRRLLRKCE